MTELALETNLDGEQREYLNVVKSSADSLLTVINDILDFSKIEAGKLELNIAEFDLRETVETTVKMLGLRAHQKGLELACEVDASVPAAVVGDQQRIRQVLVNLVGNAVKFTEHGEVLVSVRAQAASGPTEEIRGETELEFSVHDTGMGVPADKRERIFEPFEQADGSTTRRFGGTGLGLTISKRLVGIMGGRIWVDSKPGQGSAFRFTIRVTPSLGLVCDPCRDSLQLRDMPVLVVDDNATNRRILVEHLSRWGALPMVADGGVAALHIMASERKAVPLVITDCHMPGMDGFELVAAIKDRQDTATIIMLTSGGYAGDMARCKELGIEAHLTKPIGQQELLEAILRALKISRPVTRPPACKRESPAICSASGNSRSLRILLAEDNIVNQTVAYRLLQKEGHRVTTVGDGYEALRALEGSSFDLVFMDIQMPNMDGFETTAAIRARGRHTGIHMPIIAMTAHAMNGDRERCLEAGMDSYVCKPVRKAEVLDAIVQVMGDFEG